MSTGNFAERTINGLTPDVALVAPFGRGQIHDFTPRLLKALNFPRVVLPTQWDNWERPLTQPPEDGRARLGDERQSRHLRQRAEKRVTKESRCRPEIPRIVRAVNSAVGVEPAHGARENAGLNRRRSS